MKRETLEIYLAGVREQDKCVTCNKGLKNHTLEQLRQCYSEMFIKYEKGEW